MNGADTAPAITPEVVDLDLDPMMAMIGSIFPGLGDLLAEVGDPDRVTIDDLAGQLDEVVAKLDWLIGVLALAAPKIKRLGIELPPLPESD